MWLCPGVEDGTGRPYKRVVQVDRAGLYITPVLLSGLVEIGGLEIEGAAIQRQPIVGIAPEICAVEIGLAAEAGVGNDVIVTAVTEADDLRIDEIETTRAHAFIAEAMPAAIDAQTKAGAGRTCAFRKKAHAGKGALDEIIVWYLTLSITQFHPV